MDSHKEKASDESTPDTSHLSAKSKKSSKPNTKLVIILAAVVIVVAALVGGGLYYKKVADDKAAADKAAAAAAANTKKPLTPEEQMTASLTDNAQRQVDTLRQDDGHKAAIQNMTASAQAVGRNLHEQDLLNTK
jgi:flagellar basal body-associated protein FliL